MPTQTRPLTLLAFLLSLLLANCNLKYDTWKFSGESMEPNYTDGQTVTTEPVKAEDIKRGYVIVFAYPGDKERVFIKRVIGLPGETVEIRAGEIFINGTVLDEPYDASRPSYEHTVTLGADEFYVLGDNRNASSDSHIWGPLEAEFIRGVVVP